MSIYTVGNKVVNSVINPLQVAGLRLAYDFSNKGSLNNGVLNDGDWITSVKDLSGNGYHYTFSSGVAAYKENIYNGCSVARLAGTSNGSSVLLAGLTPFPYHIIMVSKNTAGGAFCFASTGGGNQMILTNPIDTTWFLSSGGSMNGGAAKSATVPNVLTISGINNVYTKTDNFKTNSKINPSAGASTFRAPGGTGMRMYIGSYVAGSYFCTGDICAVYIYNGTIDLQDLESVKRYLVKKWT